MKQYFSWNDLLYRWNKEDFELLGLIKQGLQPYSKYGHPIDFANLVKSIPDNQGHDLTGKTWAEMPWPLNDQIAEYFIHALSEAIFPREIVLKIETETDLWKLTRPTLVWLDGNDLKERWSIDEFSLCKMIVEYGLPAYDARTLRSIGSKSFDRSELGKLIIGTDDQKSHAMSRARFKPFEVDEFESDNNDLFQDVSTVRQTVAEKPHESLNDYSFHLQEDIWTINFKDEVANFKDAKGIQHIAFLIENSETEIPCKTVHSGDLSSGGALEVTRDPPLAENERERLERLGEKVYTDFKSYSDKPESVHKLKAEEEWECTRNYLFEYGLKPIYHRNGVHFKVISKVSQDDEMARTAVTKNIRNAINKIKKKMPNLAEYLENSIKTGAKCSYQPNPSIAIDWEFRLGK